MTNPAVLARAASASRYIRHRYAVVGILCVMYFITYVDRVNLSLAAPDLARSLRLSKTELGFLFSVSLTRTPPCRYWAAGFPINSGRG